MSLVKDILEVCMRVKDKRDEYKVLGHTMAELGELAEEITIYKGDSYKGAGSDGVIGEAIDTILCLVDLIYVHCESQGIELTESMLQEIAERKLNKWEYKVTENQTIKVKPIDWYAPAGFDRGNLDSVYDPNNSEYVETISDSGCGYSSRGFGAGYIDATCIGGFLWDLDSWEEPGGSLTHGGEIPCPQCNKEEYVKYIKEYEN